MEFEKDTPPTDEQRILAETKKMTMQPLNPFLKPEDTPDPIVSNQPPANLERDSENTAYPDSLIQPSPGADLEQPSSSTASSKTGLVIAVGVGGILLAIGLYFLFV